MIVNSFAVRMEGCTHYISNTWNYSHNLYPYHELYFVSFADGWVETSEDTTHIEGGYVYLIPAMTPYMCWSDHVIDKVYAEFSLEIDGEELYYEPNRVQRAIYTQKEYETLCLADPRTPEGQMWIQGEILRVMSAFHKAKRPGKEDTDLKRAVRYIHENLSAALRVPDIAAVIGWNPATFSRKFKKTYKRGVKDYIHDCLIDRLRNELLNENMTLARLADRYEFCDAYYLSAFFRRTTGEYPETYRDRRRRSREALFAGGSGKTDFQKTSVIRSETGTWPEKIRTDLSSQKSWKDTGYASGGVEIDDQRFTTHVEID